MAEYPNLRSVNPFTHVAFGEHPADRPKTIEDKLEGAAARYSHWRTTRLNERTALCRTIASVLEVDKEMLAQLITQEMGKPIVQSRAEIDKCALLCRSVAEHAEAWLAPEISASPLREARIYNESLGVIFAVMPWNYPFWQVFRALIPAIALGNTMVLKHASNVSGCAKAIDALLAKAGAPKHLLTTLFIASDRVADVIRDRRIAGITLTGSEFAGRSVAAVAGASIKPVVLELGGSNAFIVMPDADVALAIDRFMLGRFQNNGQSCIAAKRLLLHDAIADAFLFALNGRMEALQLGDPALDSTDIGPLAKSEFAKALKDQVDTSIEMGAVLKSGGRMDGGIFTPTLLTNVSPSFPVFAEETFGPVVSATAFSTLDEAIVLSNASRFGLGVSIFTAQTDDMLNRVHAFEEGAVFLNDIVYSDPVLPFGGIKNSGVGRELGRDGMLAFANRKTVVIRTF
jgi:succinate-semialdehyde dehydrogenase/glutarate-semialdehyde dehydrogenase